MIRRPPRSTLDRSSAASDVYKRQLITCLLLLGVASLGVASLSAAEKLKVLLIDGQNTVSYTHLRAHETVLDLVCRLLLEKKKLHTPTYTLT